MRGRTLAAYLLLACASVLVPQYAHAQADAILGVDTITGVTQSLTPSEAAALIAGGGGAQGLDDVITIDRTYGLSVSQATSPLIGSTSTNRFWGFWDDPTTGLRLTCIISGTPDACNRNIQILSGYTFNLRDNANADKFTFTGSTGALTNVTLDAEATGNTVTLTDERHWVVASCQNTTAQAVFDLAAANTPAPSCDTGSNTQKAYLAFDDTADEGFQDSWILPAGFTGAIDASFRWKATATSGTVGWCMQLIRVADGATSDPAFPAQASGNCVSDTVKGTTLQENVATISGVTCTSCVAGDHIYVRISRDANGSAVTDSMTGDALLFTYGRTIRIAR